VCLSYGRKAFWVPALQRWSLATHAISMRNDGLGPTAGLVPAKTLTTTTPWPAPSVDERERPHRSPEETTPRVSAQESAASTGCNARAVCRLHHPLGMLRSAAQAGPPSGRRSKRRRSLEPAPALHKKAKHTGRPSGQATEATAGRWCGVGMVTGIGGRARRTRREARRRRTSGPMRCSARRCRTGRLTGTSPAPRQRPSQEPATVSRTSDRLKNQRSS